MKLRATTRDLDHTRCFRAMLAWMTGDRFALDVVLEEAMDDPVGVPGIVFDLLEIAVSASQQLDPDICDHLRQELLVHDASQDTGQQDNDGS